MARKSATGNASTFAANMPIVVITGQEPFLLRQRTEELLAVLEAAHGEIVPQFFDGRTVQLAMVLDELRSYGLMQQHKLVIVDPVDVFLLQGQDPDDDEPRPSQPSGTITNREGLERYAANPVDHATLLLRGPTWRKSKLDKLIEQAGGVIVKVADVNEGDAIRWCIDRSRREYQVDMRADAASLLVQRVGAQLGRLDAELSKLASAAEQGQPITLDLVKSMTPMSRQEKAWEIQSEVVTGSAGRMIAKLNELIDISRQDEVPIMWAINDLLRKIYEASRMLRQGSTDHAVAGALKLWGESKGPILALAKKLPPAPLAQLMRIAIRTDQNNKRGLGDQRRNLETLCVRVADTFAPRATAR